MIYTNTKNKSEQTTFKEAAIHGLASNGGLYVPQYIPQLSDEWIRDIENYSDQEIGYHVMRPLIGAESMTDEQLKNIINKTISFEIPVVPLSNHINVLELFHGPTLAFKDVGARFMSRCLSTFSSDQKVNVLVATSGDTGSAVAHGFYEVDNVNVTILFPKEKVSDFQQYQMSSLGKNITAIEVEGTFDDCQALVKKAFSDIELNKKLNLSSANSINVARLFPQSIYYFIAYKQMVQNGTNDKLVVSVPCGNYGNITAGLVAKKMGLPIKRFIAATNANDTFYQYIKTSVFTPKPSIQTYSNAMDVGAPNNFPRIEYIFDNDYNKIVNEVSSYTYTDKQTLQKMKSFFASDNYILDPHGAVGLLALQEDISEDENGLFLATAHPQKFESVVKKAVPNYPMNTVDLNQCKKYTIANGYKQFVELIK